MAPDATQENLNMIDVLLQASENGNKGIIEAALDDFEGDLKNVINANVDGVNALVTASRHGHRNIVHWMLDNGADCEARGSCEFDGDVLENVPALWAASAAGHFAIVQALVFRGADVNARTKTNSTPLRAACFDGHCHIVSYLLKKGANPEIANRYGHTCLMIACYKGHEKCVDLLLGHESLNIDRRSNKGTTALHDAAESDNVKIFEKLLTRGARFLKNELNVSPLLTAALGGHEKIVHYFATGEFLKNFGAKNYRDIVQKKEIAEAVELLGCWYIDKKRDFSKGIEMWIWALMIRGEDHQPPQRDREDAFDNFDELRTVEEMRDILADRHRVKLNSLIVRERVLGPKHPEVSFYIRYRGAVYADAGNYDRCLSLWKYALNRQVQFASEPLNPSILSSLHSFVDLFSVMEMKNRTPFIKDLLFVWDHILERFHELQNARTGEEKDRTEEEREESEKQFSHLRCVLLLILAKVLRIAPEVAEEGTAHTIAPALRRLVRINDEKNQLLIHMACQDLGEILTDKQCRGRGRKMTEKFPNASVVEALLNAGSPVNTAMSNGERPATLAASYNAVDTLNVLITSGAHVDFTNGSGETIFDMLSESEKGNMCVGSFPLPLSCLCAAQVAKSSELLSRAGFEVPKHLQTFVLGHKK